MHRRTTTTLLAVLASAFAFTSATPAQAADESIGVDFSVTRGVPTHRASGWIYGMTENASGPADNFYREAGFRWMRAGGAQLDSPGGWVSGKYDRRWNATRAQLLRTRSLGGEFVLLPHDLWGADGYPISRFPGDNGDWTDYDRFLTRLFADVRAAGVPVQWDIWNEPNITTFWNRPQSQYFELWRRTYQRIRTEFPDQLIVGPSHAGVPSTGGWWTQYLDFVKANNVVPDIFSWHALPSDPVANVATANSTLDSRGIAHPRPYQINEYGASNEQNPGDGAWYIARLERAGADGLRANWASGGNLHNDLGNLLVHDQAGQYQPKGEWWVYRFYAGQTGQILTTTASQSYDAFATKDTGTAKVLVGGGTTTGNVSVNLRRLDTTSGLVRNNKVRVLVQRIPHNNGGAVQGPVTVQNSVVSLSGNDLTVTVPHTNVDETSTITLLPPDGSEAVTGPCDIYATGGTPCVAAHSTVRALYGTYSGNLYQVRRSSDNTTRNIAVLTAGGNADAAAQDSFCANTSCVVTVVYDQSGRGNDLWYQGSAQVPGSPQSKPASATSESLTIGSDKAYSLYINPGNSYWRDGHLTGVPTGSAPEGMYMVTSGTHVNGGCCFDYGNSETTRKADAAGAMDAINFSTQCWFGGCSGTGPWVQADLEWGLFPGGSKTWNPNQRAFPQKFVTAMLKNNGTSRFALKGGNAQSGDLTTLWDGSLPSGYSPMKKQGAIILGSGGDCCKPDGGANLSAGTFYEGAMVSGYPSDATDNAVQANVIAAGYRTGGTGTTGAVRSVAAGRCLDVSGASTTVGTATQIWDCNSGANQTWARSATGQLTVYNGTRCAAPSGNQTTPGTAVVIAACDDSADQRWQVNANGTVTSTRSGLCLDVNGAATANGTKVILWTCHGGSNQQWTFS